MQMRNACAARAVARKFQLLLVRMHVCYVRTVRARHNAGPDGSPTSRGRCRRNYKRRRSRRDSAMTTMRIITTSSSSDT